MALKEFKFRGKSMDELRELSNHEFAELLPARQRRSIKRGMSDAQKNVHKHLEKKGKAKTHRRDLIILPGMVGKTVSVHNGKEFISILITEEMIGHVVGEFSMTRKLSKHSAPGVGATKSSGAVSVK